MRRFLFLVVGLASMVLVGTGCATTGNDLKVNGAYGQTLHHSESSTLNKTTTTTIDTKQAFDDCMARQAGLPQPQRELMCASLVSSHGGGAATASGMTPGAVIPYPLFDATPPSVIIATRSQIPGVMAIPVSPHTASGSTNAPTKQDVEDAMAESLRAQEMACAALKAQGKSCSSSKRAR